MNCRAVKNLLKEAVAGEISLDQRQILEVHMAECTACAKEYSSLLETIEIAAKTIPPDPTERGWQVFRNNLRREINKYNSPAKLSTPHPVRRSLIPALAAIAAVIVVSLIVLHAIDPNQPDVSNQSDLWIAVEDELIDEFDLEDLYAYDSDSSDLEEQLEELDL